MKRKLLAVGFGLTLLWLAEIALRLGGVQAAYQPSTQAGWRMSPNLDSHRMQGAREPHDFTVTTNADGLRSTLPRARTALKRVAIMGDSNVFGWGVQEEHTVAAQMQEHMPGWEVLNAGQPGYTMWQVGWLWDEVVSEYDPDVVLVWLPQADHNLALVSDRERVEGGTRLLLARHSRIYALMRTLIWSRADQEYVLPLDADGEPRVPRVTADERRQVLDRLAEDTTLVLGLIPFYADLGVRVPQDRMGLSEALGLDLPIVDVRDCCGSSTNDANAMTFEFDRGHFNALGNDPLGEAAAAALLRELDRDQP
mgnify:CR=1 FL=1